MSARSSREDVRNPMVALPEVIALRDLDPTTRAAVEAAFRAISKNARERADKALRTRKPPMYAYWQANAVHFRHLALAIRAR